MPSVTKAALTADLEALRAALGRETACREQTEKQLAEAREEQTATRDVLRIISSSSMDLVHACVAILANATRLCEAQLGNLFVYDGDAFHAVAHHNASQPFVDVLTGALRPGLETGVEQWLANPIPVQIADVRATRPYSESEGYAVVAADLEGIRTLLAVPLMNDGRLVGVITIYRREIHPFADTQIDMAKTFADQAVVAIENVGLFTELQQKNQALTQAHAQVTEALEQQTATSEILRVISSSPTEVRPVFEAIVTSGMRLLHAHSAAVTRVVGEELHLVALTMTDQVGNRALAGVFPAPLGNAGILSLVVRERRAVIVGDTETDESYRGPMRAMARERGYRSAIGVPMLRDGIVVGTISVTRREAGSFSDEQSALLQIFADQAVIAIENVRLFTELQHKNEALTQAHAQVSEALERQTATSEILKIIASAPTDPTPVFDAICRSGHHLFNALATTIMRFDGEFVNLAAITSSNADAAAGFRAAYPQRPGADLATGRAIRNAAIVQVADTEDDPSERQRAVGRAFGFRRILVAPLLLEGHVVGTVTVTAVDPGTYSEGQIELLRVFADQAVIAIENVRLFKELQQKNEALTQAHAHVTEALEQQTATSGILRVISQSPTDVQPVFDTIVRNAVRLCDGIYGQVFQFDGELIHLVAQDIPPDRAEQWLQTFPRPLTNSGGVGRVITTGAVLRLADVESDPDAIFSPAAHARMRDLGTRSLVLVPMFRRGLVIGVIVVTHRNLGAFADAHVDLLKTFADQAVIAIENVRLFTELQQKNQALGQAHAQVTEALEQQTATSEILRVISRSPTDAQPVFDSVVCSARRLCEANDALIYRIDADALRLVAHDGPIPAGHVGGTMPLVPGVFTGRVVLDRRVIHLPDLQAEADEYPEGSALGRRFGHRTLLGVPLLRAGEAIGAIVLRRREVHPFTDAQIELLKTFADQAVIAIENVRLFTELEARTAALTRSVEQLTALGDVSRAVSSTLDLDAVLDAIVMRASQLAGADGCSIWEYDEAREEFHQRATYNVDPAVTPASPAFSLRKGEGLMGRAAETREAMQIGDIAAEGAYDSRIRDTLLAAGYRALLSVPLVRDEEMIGSLSLTRKAPGEFSTEVIDLLKTFATQSALAIQNARLFREIEEKSRQLEVASQHKSEFLANMSHELRTPLNGIIGFSEVMLERMFGDINEKQEEYLNDILTSGRHLLSLINDILDLSKIEAGRMELDLASFDLPTAVDDAMILMRERASRRGIALERHIDERLGEIRADQRKVKQVLLNLLSNAVKFTPEGGAIDVRAAFVDGTAEISVTDTGVGIASEDHDAVFEEFRQVGKADKKAEGTGLGLALCRKFVELHGGRIWVKSQLSAGSTFTFTLPLRT